MAGRVIVLNGTSSAGKTSLARWLQVLWPAPMLYSGLDHPKLMAMPLHLHGTEDGPHCAGDDHARVIKLGPTALTLMGILYRAEAQTVAQGRRSRARRGVRFGRRRPSVPCCEIANPRAALHERRRIVAVRADGVGSRLAPLEDDYARIGEQQSDAIGKG